MKCIIISLFWNANACDEFFFSECWGEVCFVATAARFTNAHIDILLAFLFYEIMSVEIAEIVKNIDSMWSSRESISQSHTKILATCLGLEKNEAFCVRFLFRKNRLSTTLHYRNILKKNEDIRMGIENYLNDCLYASNGL